MNPRYFFVFDLETIPCTQTARALLSLPDEAPEDEVVSKLTEYHLGITNGQNAFHRQPFHRIVCLSYVYGTISRNGSTEEYTIKQISTGGKNNESEEDILRRTMSHLQAHPARLITFNGRTFDLPVLQYRCLKYGISAEWLYRNNYGYRYSFEKHCDLLEAFSNFGTSARIKMSEIAALLSIPCKLSVSGGDVLPLYNEGKLEEICNYCETDAVCTYMLFLHYMKHTGNLSPEGYSKAMKGLLEYLNGQDSPEHLQNYYQQILALSPDIASSLP